MSTPDIIFIIPYRDRLHQLSRWIDAMTSYLEGIDYQVIVVHQMDTRRFNRGAIKNLGFLQVKEMYPSTYQDITLVFNDVDTIPVKHFDFRTTRGTVKHLFGFRFAFGGLFSMTAGDFEKIGGFPNLWSWGLEDNLLKERWITHFGEESIDFRQFVAISGKTPEELKEEILFDRTGERGREIEVQVGYYVKELRSKNAQERATNTPLSESIQSIRRVQKYTTSIDTLVQQANPRISVCTIVRFDCGTTDNGVYERRTQLSKIRRQKVLTMKQLMRFGK